MRKDRPPRLQPTVLYIENSPRSRRDVVDSENPVFYSVPGSQFNSMSASGAPATRQEQDNFPSLSFQYHVLKKTKRGQDIALRIDFGGADSILPNKWPHVLLFHSQHQSRRLERSDWVNHMYTEQPITIPLLRQPVTEIDVRGETNYSNIHEFIEHKIGSLPTSVFGREIIGDMITNATSRTGEGVKECLEQIYDSGIASNRNRSRATGSRDVTWALDSRPWNGSVTAFSFLVAGWQILATSGSRYSLLGSWARSRWFLDAMIFNL
nr:hypothetical protein L204_00446 [Cryptococcus depauperatus CBS 7855]